MMLILYFVLYNNNFLVCRYILIFYKMRLLQVGNLSYLRTLANELHVTSSVYMHVSIILDKGSHLHACMDLLIQIIEPRPLGPKEVDGLLVSPAND